MKGVPDKQRTARFVCAVAAVFPNGDKEVVRGTMEGCIGYEIAGANGFGYDPIFFLPEYGCTSAELAPEKKNELSHRGEALRMMRQIMEEKVMRVLIISDTHGRHTAFDRAIMEAGKIDYLVHLGDTEGGEDYIEAFCGCPAYILAGNNDFFSRNLREMEIYFGKKKAFMAHGHQYSVSLGVERILDEGRSRNADIVMFGHTHRPYLKKFGDITVLNPGSLAFPRQEGRKGSYIIMEMDRDGNAEFTIHYLD